MAFPDGPWSVAQGTYNDHPLIVRINAGAAALRGMPALRHRIGIAVPLTAPSADGLPTAGEQDTLYQIEDALGDALTVGREAVLLLTTTTSGLREFVFHTTAPEMVAAAVARVRDQFPTHDLQLVQEDDFEWEVYRQFTE